MKHTVLPPVYHSVHISHSTSDSISKVLLLPLILPPSYYVIICNYSRSDAISNELPLPLILPPWAILIAHSSTSLTYIPYTILGKLSCGQIILAIANAPLCRVFALFLLMTCHILPGECKPHAMSAIVNPHSHLQTQSHPLQSTLLWSHPIIIILTFIIDYLLPNSIVAKPTLTCKVETKHCQWKWCSSSSCWWWRLRLNVLQHSWHL